MRILLVASLALLLSFNATSQDYWKTYRQKDGLASDTIIDLAIGDDEIFLATSKGFSVFKNEQFENYDSANSTLPSSNIKQLVQFNDTVWMRTDSGLSQFYKGTFKHYDTTNGLVKAEVRDMVVDSKGALWLGSLDGLTKKVGDEFTTDSTRKIYGIAINEGDSIYANVNTPQIFSSSLSFISFDIYHGSNWLEPTYNVNQLGGVELFETSDGQVGLTTGNLGCFYIDKNLNFQQYYDNSSPIIQFYRRFDIDSQGRVWIPYIYAPNNNTNIEYYGIQRWMNNNDLERLRTGLPEGEILLVKHNNGKIYLGSNDGFAISSDTISTFSQETSLETSSVSAVVRSDGMLFANITRDEEVEFNSGFEFPKGSNKNLINNGVLWFYAEDNDGNQYLSAANSLNSDFEAGTINDNEALIRSPKQTVSRADINYHLKNYQNPGYVMPNSIKNWGASYNAEEGEAVDLAPFIDVNNNGCYEPSKGDYPYLLGDQSVYFVYNDMANGLFAEKTNALGVEVHGTAYIYDRPAVEHIDRSVFFRYFIVNRSSKTYNLTAGLNFDFDVGYLVDDYVGCDPGSSIMYAYNSVSNDGFSDPRYYGDYIPAVGVKVFNRKLNKFIAFNSSGNQGVRPFEPSDYVNVMNGKWSDGSFITFGEDGYDPAGTESSFIFPGDPKNPNEWSMLNPKPGQSSLTWNSLPSTLGVIEPVLLEPGERMQLDFVVGVGFDSSNTNYLDNIELLIDNLNKAARFQQGVDEIAQQFSYSNCTTGIGENFVKDDKKPLVVFPNPTSGTINVLADKKIEQLMIYGLQGKLVQTVKFDQTAASQAFTVNQEILNGMYLIRCIDKNGNSYSERFILQR